MRLAITGGAGFVGTNLALAALDCGQEVVLYDVGDRLGRLAASGLLEAAECRFGDLAEPGARLGADADVIVHLAALPHVDHSLHEPDLVVRNNLASTAAVLSSARRDGLPVVFTSSIEVYGGNDGALFREDDPLTSLSPYAASKIGCEALVDAYQTAYGLTATVARLTNLYGPWQAPDRIIPRVTTQALLGRRSQVVRGRLRDFMHVDDAVSALLALIDRRGHWSLPEEAESVRENPWHSPEPPRAAGDRADRGEGVFNVATGNATALEAAASSLTGRLDLVDVAESDGRGRSLVASPDRLNVTTGWKSLVPLEEGIERTVAWYSEGRDWWAPFAALIRAERQGPGFLVDRAFPI